MSNMADASDSSLPIKTGFIFLQSQPHHRGCAGCSAGTAVRHTTRISDNKRQILRKTAEMFRQHDLQRSQQPLPEFLVAEGGLDFPFRIQR